MVLSDATRIPRSALARSEHGGRDPPDWCERSDLLSLAPGVRWAEDLAPSHSITSSARASSAGGTASQHLDPMKTLLVSLDRLDQMLRVRIRQNFRIQAGQYGFERLTVDFCDSHA